MSPDIQRDHSAKVREISAQVKGFYDRKVPFRIFHGSTNSTRILSFKRGEMIDTSGLDQILSVDTKRQTTVVEPNVPMDALVDATLRQGLLPPVVTEFPGITVGGGLQGGAGESSSFKWGFLSQTVNWVEYVLANGSVVRASPTERADLFYGAAGSCGTLGIITAAELRLIPAKRYVNLTYKPVANFKATITTLEQTAKEQHDFIDGILFGKDHGLVITGELSDTPHGKIRRFSRARDPWYYLHAARIDKGRKSAVETVPLKDYLFRYNRGAFWVGRYAFARFGVPFNALTRFMFNPILSTHKLYQALQVSAASQEYIVQDLTLPLSKAEKFLDFIDRETAIYPLWLCPIKPTPKSPLLCNGLDTPLAINIGVWGPQMADYGKFKELNRRIETRLSLLGGKKWMYAHAYYPPEEFWDIYDKKWYERLRQKYHAETLPDFYEKTHVREHYKVSARLGLLRTILGTAKLRVHE